MQEDLKEEAGESIMSFMNMEVNGLNGMGEVNDTSTQIVKDKVGQEQIHSLLFSDKLSWQSIIYDLINTDQLNPWDIDISLLTGRYLERIRELEEANFFISSKVLLAASFLLRIKSEILLNRDIQSLDDILFGKKEDKKYVQERIELDEDVPGLIPRTPLPRFRKVTLQELMSALGKAIKTENRRIKRVVLEKQQEIETALALPKTSINLKDQINGVYKRLKEIFSNREEKFAFSELAGETNESRISTFIPLLHLDTQQKVWLEQEQHFEEIWILLKHIYEKQNASALKEMREEVEKDIEEYENNLSEEEKKRAEELERDFKEPLEENN